MCDRKPNILISGTPGSGKSSLCQKLIKNLPKNELKYIEISEFCKQNNCIESRDEQLDTDVINEELLEEKLTPIIRSGGYLIDYHSGADLFDKELIDVVFIMRCNNTILYDRLKSRNGYSDLKINNNIECEIFEMIAEEAIEWFGSNSVIQLKNETEDQLESNCRTIETWIQNYNISN